MDERSTAAQVVEAFFDAYRNHDVNRMIELCSEDADLSYVPVEIAAKQRVMRGDGKVCVLGRPIWYGLISAFPDLTNEIASISASEDGRVAVEVTIGGTQARDWGPIGASGRSYAVPHLFLMDVGEDGLITSITAYWDNATMYRQLGHLEVD
jgi:steroid delta-isomerase-like uncharacterized protein